MSSVLPTSNIKGFPKILLSFAPTWWHHYYGMEYSSDYWHDPIARTERWRDQRRLLFDRFGDVGLGEKDPKPQPVAGDAYGHRFMSAFWGCEVQYVPDQFPSAIPLPDAHVRMVDIEVPYVEDSLVVRQLYDEARILQEHYGQFEAVINFGGPLNNAVSVLGGEIYAALKAQPELARGVLQRMGETVVTVHKKVVCALNKTPASEVFKKDFGLGNCPVGSISPRTYQELILPADLWIRQKFTGKFNLHHCGLFQQYATVYRPLRPTSLDVGPGTDLRATRAAYPDTPISTYLEVGGLAGITRDRLDAMLEKMIEDAAPPNLFPLITVAEAGPEISDETVIDLMTARDRIPVVG